MRRQEERGDEVIKSIIGPYWCDSQSEQLENVLDIECTFFIGWEVHVLGKREVQHGRSCEDHRMCGYPQGW